jgi:hypothetical protein
MVVEVEVVDSATVVIVPLTIVDMGPPVELGLTMGTLLTTGLYEGLFNCVVASPMSVVKALASVVVVVLTVVVVV